MITHPTETMDSVTRSEYGVVCPQDDHNQKLVDNVHPSSWINP